MAEIDMYRDLDALPTPALVVDAAIVQQNIDRLTAYANWNDIRIRPHIKTHKSRHIAELQMRAGANGFTAAKITEAEVISLAGDDVLLAYPAVGEARARRLATLARDRVVHAAIDSVLALEIVARESSRMGVDVGLLVDIDVGLGRTGVESPQQALDLAIAIDRCASVRLDGIMCYPGHIWDKADQQQTALEAVDTILDETIQIWGQHGLAAEIVSGGSTPTAYQSHFITRLTEIRPGTYVFNDMNTARGGFCNLADCAGRVVTTVVSTSISGQVVVDAGSKVLAMDLCIPDPTSGFGYVVELPQARVSRLSEEHGQIDVTACDIRPKVGDRLTIIPNHICPCINLRSDVWWSEAGECLQRLVIQARGAVL